MGVKSELENKIDDILTRGVGEFVDPGSIFRNKLIAKAKGESSEDIIIKFGIDPTRPDIHLGHAVVLRKLRQLQDLGCKVVFLIGDFTAQIGDPTGKSNVRPEIDQAEAERNMRTYLEQVGKLLVSDEKFFSWIRNSDWFTAITDIVAPKGSTVGFRPSLDTEEFKIDANSFVGKALIFQKTRMQKLDKDIAVITLRSFLWALKHITHSQIIDRDLFQDRITNKKELYLHEMMYPVLQGIDSRILDHVYGSCDLEVGGTDQHFNMLMGRSVMNMNKKSPQAVLSFKILEGTDGKDKMSKSLDNYIGITDEPNDMYGKVMSIPDSSIANYFELCTYTSLDEVAEIKNEIEKGKKNPKDFKMKLAHQIVSEYHGKQKADEAQENFINTFQKREEPTNWEEIVGKVGEKISEILVSKEIVKSKSDWRRLVDAGAVEEWPNKNPIVADQIFTTEVKLRIGKKRFVRLLPA